MRRAVRRRPIDATVVEQVGRLFIPISAILDLCTDLAGHDLQQVMRDILCGVTENIGRRAKNCARIICPSVQAALGFG